MSTAEIIVGTDGSASADAAVRWAAAESIRVAARLRIVHVYHWHWPGRLVSAEEMDRLSAERADRIVADALAVARAAQPRLNADGTAVMGMPADVLITMAAGAALVAVGSHGDHGFVAALLGSVALEVANHAPRPVAVVRGHADAATGPVLAAVDGSEATDRVLATAFDAAARRGCDLAVIRVHAPHLPPWGIGKPLLHPPDEARAAIAAELTRSVASWQAKYPDVRADVRLAEGNPAQILTEASRDAQLTVAGARGHGGFAGLRLGSVSHHLLHHAGGPVLVAR
jgi:nucleotide-binding universal stress UspA family protein